jgi:hypothetical protein
MQKRLFNLFAYAALIFVACDQPTFFKFNDGLLSEFTITDPSGQQTNTFEVGQDVTFNYKLQNLSGEDQPFTNPNTGPFVTFELYRDGAQVGTSDDGFDYAAVIVRDTLLASAKLASTYDWHSVVQHNLLPPGQYSVFAKPQLNFDDVETPEAQRIDFTVSGNAGHSGNFVIITEQPPDSLQLDPFSLRSLSISGDTLTMTITHGGGCKEHNYTLFMSPGVFLESYPVQANLFLRHEDNDDACDALITATLKFNLRPVADLYQYYYRGKDEIIINAFDYDQTSPGSKLSARYFPN